MTAKFGSLLCICCPISSPARFLATIWSDNDKRRTCELATAPYSAQMPAPSLLSLPPTTPGYHMLIVVFESAFGPHFWAEMNAIVVNGTIAATRKICHFGTLFCFACPRSSTVQYLPRSLRRSVVILTTCTRSH